MTVILVALLLFSSCREQEQEGRAAASGVSMAASLSRPPHYEEPATKCDECSLCKKR